MTRHRVQQRTASQVLAGLESQGLYARFRAALKAAGGTDDDIVPILGRDASHRRMRHGVWYFLYADRPPDRSLWIANNRMAQLWGVHPGAITQALERYCARHRLPMPTTVNPVRWKRPPEGGPSKQPMIGMRSGTLPGVAIDDQRRSNCTNYRSCLTMFASISNGNGHCPRDCAGFRETNVRATDFLKQLEAGSVPSAARPQARAAS